MFRLSLCRIHETRPGEEVVLEKVRTETENGDITYVIEGKTGDKACFIVKINL